MFKAIIIMSFYKKGIKVLMLEPIVAYLADSLPNPASIKSSVE